MPPSPIIAAAGATLSESLNTLRRGQFVDKPGLLKPHVRKLRAVARKMAAEKRWGMPLKGGLALRRFRSALPLDPLELKAFLRAESRVIR